MNGSLYNWFEDDEPRNDLIWDIEELVDEHGLGYLIQNPLKVIGMDMEDLKPFLCELGYCSIVSGSFYWDKARIAPKETYIKDPRN